MGRVESECMCVSTCVCTVYTGIYMYVYVCHHTHMSSPSNEMGRAGHLELELEQFSIPKIDVCCLLHRY